MFHISKDIQKTMILQLDQSSNGEKILMLNCQVEWDNEIRLAAGFNETMSWDFRPNHKLQMF